ncbi:MAG: bifunctional phosphoserine phosphatase/homoserine phosphotransferase ThrH [Bacteroidales bacterium]|jgi:phosphoserine / homoserine phosphotransferase|nr:bifunctional phosphoserine phosphatase/homoserine phosphotransferase ThrH [Bacteroidales bacterium]
MKKLHAVCSDLEGVWVPEVWINVAERTGIPELRLTTRDIKNYDELMQHRLKILRERNLTLLDIQRVIATIRPLHGALEIINWLKRVTRFIVVSDTFVEFADPLMEQLDRPTLFCHSLEVNSSGIITGYNLRQKDAKRETVKALKSLNYEVIAFGDSYNDISMLLEADQGILFRPPENVIKDYPDLPVIQDYSELKCFLEARL